MFKSVFLAMIAVTAFSLSGLSYVGIDRYNRGMFGYKDVSADYSNGNSVLACANPGWTACKWKNGFVPSVVIDDNGTLQSIDDTQPIEDAAMSRITRDNLSGSFYYGSNLYVQYSYATEGDHLAMKIYSLYEAHKLGLI
jgi:hypothetical protein